MSNDQFKEETLKGYARVLAWENVLDQKKVLRALRRIEKKYVINLDDNEGNPNERFYTQPSLETAFRFLKPNVALELFLHGDHNEIEVWLNHTHSIFCNFVKFWQPFNSRASQKEQTLPF